MAVLFHYTLTTWWWTVEFVLSFHQERVGIASVIVNVTQIDYTKTIDFKNHKLIHLA